ncbi:MAG: phytoene desaturase [Myxococcales bacterium FL481]|nr:MAG: phytoene desaturase [Myxococcales bacterium FL481]
MSTAIKRRGKRALVIGAGLGGLAAAMRLSVRGYDVEVVERLDTPGGRASVIRDSGYVFDCGPTVITAPFLLEELWQLAGLDFHQDVDLRPVTPFYRVYFDDGQHFDYEGDTDRMREQIAALHPPDAAGYDAFLEASRRIFDIGFTKLAHAPFHRASRMLRIVPSMIRLRSHESVYGLVSRYVKHPKTRQVLSFHPLLVGGNPFSTTSVYSLIAHLERKWGVHFAMGGTGAIVSALVDRLRERGVRFRFDTTVRKIAVENRRVTGLELEDGQRLPADVVVSNADAAWTIRHLLAPADRPSWTDRRVEKSRYSMSLFVWYFGTRRQYPNLPHHSIVLGPRYRGLLRDIFNKKVLAEDFSLYLHRPTATDPSLAPAGSDAFYVLSPVPHLDAGIDWRRAAEPYRQRIQAHLERTLMPGLSQSIEVSHTLDPQGFRDNLLSYKGAAFSFEPVLRQSAYFRPHNRFGDVQGLYLVGAGTHPGAGVPGVLSSARVLDEVVPDPSPVHAAVPNTLAGAVG